MLDGIEDPYNLGQALRSLYAAGATGVVLRPHNPMEAEDIVLRASAGASELMSIALAEDAEAAANLFRDRGLTVMAATQTDAIPMHGVDFAGPFFLLVGGEKRGIRRSLERHADVRVTVPYGRVFEAALGAAAASTVLGFEMLRQRQRSGSAE
jgi:23S rRNA (guanosine2251-2'-O)-methyltransferase